MVRLSSENSVLVVIDIQDKLLAKIPTAASLVANTAFLLEAAKLAGVPCLATEQYPQGLGPTLAALARHLTAPPLAKTAFSCCGAAGFLDQLRALARPNVVLAGMEAHVCVLQTALDLIGASFPVVLPVDALASRTALDAEVAIRRMTACGATAATVEAIGFEWLADSRHPQFKAFSQLVITRLPASLP